MHSYKTGTTFLIVNRCSTCLRQIMGSKKQEGMGRLCSWQWRAIIEHSANFRNISTRLLLLNTGCIPGVSNFLTLARFFPLVYILELQSRCRLPSLPIHLSAEFTSHNLKYAIRAITECSLAPFYSPQLDMNISQSIFYISRHNKRINNNYVHAQYIY